MVKTISFPQNQIFWQVENIRSKKLTEDIKTDVLVIGGGMAGLSAAQSFSHKGYSVVLIEKYFCGAGASGKSSGLITPESELSLLVFVKRYGLDEAKRIWDFATSGVQLIQQNIKDFSINCDYQDEEALVAANSDKGFSKLQDNHTVYQKLGYKSFLYTKETVQEIIGSNKYFGGIHYPGTFGINCFLYCQAMKEVLEQKGVRIFEDTQALKINGNIVETSHSKITAKHIIVCLDRFLPELHKLSPDVFQAQTFLMVSEPLSDNCIQTLFPQKKLMVWDTDMIYQYYRIIDNNRLLIGGSDFLSIFWGKEQYNVHRMYRKLDTYIKTKFPTFDIRFEYMWPGLIGVSKDVFPIACPDENNPNIYYITCCAGLPWAAAVGWYSAERIAHNKKDFDDYFFIKNRFRVSNFVQKILGKRITFALSFI